MLNKVLCQFIKCHIKEENSKPGNFMMPLQMKNITILTILSYHNVR